MVYLESAVEQRVRTLFFFHFNMDLQDEMQIFTSIHSFSYAPHVIYLWIRSNGRKQQFWRIIPPTICRSCIRPTVARWRKVFPQASRFLLPQSDLRLCRNTNLFILLERPDHGLKLLCQVIKFSIFLRIKDPSCICMKNIH